MLSSSPAPSPPHPRQVQAILIDVYSNGDPSIAGFLKVTPTLTLTLTYTPRST